MDNDKNINNSTIKPCFSVMIDIQESKRIRRFSEATDATEDYSTGARLARPNCSQKRM